jgi:Chitobiase/beta-hexosaminidase C-terminal domain
MAFYSIDQLKRMVHLNTGFFETNQYTTETQMPIVSGNFDGAGLSSGNLQYNFGPADRGLELYTYLINNHMALVNESFGIYTSEKNEFINAITTMTRAQRIDWGETLTDRVTDPDARTLFPPWEECLGKLLLTPESIAKYNQMADTYYWELAFDLFRQINCNSLASLASIYDLNINRGRFYPINTLIVDFELIDARLDLTDFQKEAEKIRMINVRGNDTTNAMAPSSAQWFVQRRECQGNQGGTYYGSLYDPEVQFDITQDVAIPEKAGVQPVNLKLGEIDVQNIFLGTTPISTVYLGTTLLGGAVGPYTTSKVPDTQFRTNEGSYAGFEGGAVTLDSGAKVWVDVQNFVGAKTYFTTDGTTPTTASPVYHVSLAFTESCILKTLTVSTSGIAEPVKTLEVTVNVPQTGGTSGWRYVRYIGHGDNTGITSRLVELQALEGATNRLLNKLPMPGYPAPPLGNIAVATDGAKVQASGYPLWWSGEGIPQLTYDLGAIYMIDMINVTGYSTTIDPRQTQFIIQLSKDGIEWAQLANFTNNTTPQPEDGWYFPIEF